MKITPVLPSPSRWDDIEAAKAFFIELVLKLEGETEVEGPLIGNLIGLGDVRATLAMMRTPDGPGIELDEFHTPSAQTSKRLLNSTLAAAPVEHWVTRS